ncbi:MAG: hypothetical protein ABIL58_17600 [Pseudomonadota bacterium]
MAVEERDVSCACGNTYPSSLSVNWCPKCGKRVFDTEKERRRHKVSTYYYYGISLVAVSALTYFFVELILIPIFTMTAQ